MPVNGLDLHLSGIYLLCIGADLPTRSRVRNDEGENTVRHVWYDTDDEVRLFTGVNMLESLRR